MKARAEWLRRLAETIGDKPIPVSGDGDYILDTTAFIPSLVEADMRRHGIPKGGKVCLETTPISKVPIGGVFICKEDIADRWEVHRKANTPIGYVFIESELIYATGGMVSHGDKVCRYYFPSGDTPVVYTGIVLKGEIA